MHYPICSRTCHGEQCTGKEVCGPQYHAVHSSRKRTYTHEPKRRSTIRGCHKRKKCLKIVLCTVASEAKDEKRENYAWWRLGRREKLRLAEIEHCFRVCMGLVGLPDRKAISWLFTSFRDFEPPEHVPRTLARAHTRTQCSPGPPHCPATASKRNDPRAEEQIMPMSKKSSYHTLQCVVDRLLCKISALSTQRMSLG